VVDFSPEAAQMQSMEVYLLDKKKELSDLITSMYPGREILYFLDSKVKLFHVDVVDAMNSFPIFAGERAKSVVGVMDVQNQLINSDSKDPIVVVMGGGTVLDTSGFALATFTKKLKTIFVPTTFSSQLEGFFKEDVYINFDRVKDVMKVRFQPNLLVNVMEFTKTQSFEEKRNSFIHAAIIGLSHSKRFFRTAFKVLTSNLLSNEEMIKYILFESIQMRANTKGRLVGEESARALITASKLEMPYLTALQYGVLIESFISNKFGFLSDESLKEVYNSVRMCGNVHFDLSSAVEELSYQEEPLKVRLPIKIGSAIEYQIFPGFLTEMIYSAHSKGFI